MLGYPIASYPVAGAPNAGATTPPVSVQVRTVSVAMGDANGPASNIQGVKVSFAAGTGPHDAGPYLYQSATQSLGGDGALTFTLPLEAIAAGASGVLCVLLPDGRRLLRIVTVA